MATMIAYLIIREGAKWTDVYRLAPGQVVTIGRAPTNQIVIKDERASREHAEIFLAGDHWTVRDLDSRNGTFVGQDQVRGDLPLRPGNIIRIGQAQMAFVVDLAAALPDSSAVFRRATALGETMVAPSARLGSPPSSSDDAPKQSGTTAAERPSEITVDAEHVLADDGPEAALITHRRGQTKFLATDDRLPEAAAPRVGRGAAKLCRLAFDLAKATDLDAMAQFALSRLFEETHVDAGAVLLLPRDPVVAAASNLPPPATHGAKVPAPPITAADLQVVASRSDSTHSYHRPSDFLVSTVLREGEAVLARNIVGDSKIGMRDSEGEILATSIICAPIRLESNILGFVHLYSTHGDRQPDPDDLEFTLAVADTVAVAVDNLSRRQELAEDLDLARQENMQLLERLGLNSEIIGSSPAMVRVAQDIARAAPSRATILIRGESGVGKELVARAVHFSSPRRKGPFICLNCAALTESLLESELFGHEKGAFTGATERKSGKFEQSHGGTLMLDEIGEMSPSIQAKFLRVLEGHPFERVGGSESIRVDVRVIAATNRDLEKDVAEKLFRRDLYFRLRVVEIIVPPLRKRPEDIVQLAGHFLVKYVEETGRKIRGYTPLALEQMQRYRWPGNVRELKNVVERAVVLSRGPFIEHTDLMLSQLATAGDTTDLATAARAQQFVPMSLDDMEARHILATLQATNWNKSQSAHLLNIERTTLDRKIRRYNLSREAASPQ
jgi:Nif-specific regulatory protein